MTDELYEHFTSVVQENNELSTKLQHAEIEIARLKSANERLENRLLTLNEQLEDANNEIGRMGMVLKHRKKDIQSEKHIGKRNEWPFLAARHH